MTWEQKVMLVKLSEASCKKAFREFVVNNMYSFDEQGLAIFADVETVNPKYVRNNIEYYKKVIEFINNTPLKPLGLRACMRLSFMKSVFEYVQKHTNPEQITNEVQHEVD